jgi:asparagine synthase (glutamine-hydrolysing)
MCGILGQISISKNFDLNQEIFIDALNLQKHRGPDDSGIVIDANFIFGHRRLSIIDLDDHAKQPMQVLNKLVTIIFNGEIYNFQEIKHDLIDKGYKFITSGDTEVILNAYLEYGIDCIHKFIGMFAFAIYDKRNGKTFLVRDRLGVKPLYYYKDQECICFSSEIKSIMKIIDKKFKLNNSAISSYLSFRYPILDDTFFEEILSLPPANYMEIDITGSLRLVEYWNLAENFLKQKQDYGEEYYISKLRELLKSSVKYRMISDVPFGAFLSGGVDSSIITAIMSEESNEPVKTFTIGFEEDGFNEFEYAKIVADKYQTNHKEITISGDDYIQTMEKLIDYKDAPLSVPNEVPLYLMSQELKKYITVVLSGEGADEIFGGYGRIFRSPYDYQRMVETSETGFTLEETKVFIKKIIHKYQTDQFDDILDHFISIYSYTDFSTKGKLINNSIVSEKYEEKFKNKFKQYFEELGEDESYENKMMYVFEKIHLVGLLQRVDTATMAASVEARVPFVDHRLVEFAFTIPLHYKLKWESEDSHLKAKFLMSHQISEKLDIPKYILKKAYEDKIPSEVLYRKKLGFPVPLNNWFGGNFNSYARSILLSEIALNRGIYNLEGIQEWLDNSQMSNDHGHAMKIWMLINLELFLKKYFGESK